MQSKAFVGKRLSGQAETVASSSMLYVKGHLVTDHVFAYRSLEMALMRVNCWTRASECFARILTWRGLTVRANASQVKCC